MAKQAKSFLEMSRLERKMDIEEKKKNHHLAVLEDKKEPLNMYEGYRNYKVTRC